MWKIEEIKPTQTVPFIRLYQKVFGGEPYNEKWTFKEVLEEKKLIISEQGKLIGFYQDEKLIGFVTYRNMLPNEHPGIIYPESENVGYISDIAVLKECRNKGIGSMLFEACLENMRAEGFTIALMRTLKNGSMSYNIAKRHGLKEITGKEEIVQKARMNNNKSQKDIRIFLDVKL